VANPTVYTNPPARKARKGGLLNVIGGVTSLDRLGVASTVEWTEEACNPAMEIAPGLCWGTVSATTKEYADITTGESLPVFAGYYGVECFLGGDDYDARARRGLEATEGRFIEKQLYDLALEPAVAAPFADAVTVVAALDGYADANYIGQPIIHASRAGAVIAGASQAIYPDQPRDGDLFTANGTPVVASSEYGSLVGLPGAWATGWITVYGGPVVVTRTYDLLHNREMAVAERIYAIAIDCNFVYGAAVTP
jgi:hypothetical protein